MSNLTIDERVQGMYLGLGDLGAERNVCHGYVNACICEDCQARENQPSPAAPVAQPWEVAAA